MNYLTPTGLVARFGIEELAQAADRATPRRVTTELLQSAIAGDSLAGWHEGDVEAVTRALQAIEQAILDAETLVDGVLAARYQVPFSGSHALLARLTGEIARGFLLGDQAPESVLKTSAGAQATLRAIGEGRILLAGQSAPAAQPSHVTTMQNGRDTVFSRRKRPL